MNYSQFINLKEKYDDILERRLETYADIMQTKKTKYRSNDYSNFSERETYSTHIEYHSFGITIKYERYWSGCGSEDFDFTAPKDILDLEDDEEFYDKIRAEIKIHNEEFDKAKKIEEESKLAIKEEEKKQKELKTLATLKAKYE